MSLSKQEPVKKVNSRLGIVSGCVFCKFRFPEASFVVLSILFVLMSGRVSPKLVSVVCMVLFCTVLSFDDLACALSV